MKKLILFCLLCLQFVYAQIEFPKLTGQVVDNANLLTQQTRASLTKMLQQHEKLTTNQIVVVTLPTLNGYEIADYGYQLGRHWGIGTKEKNNGVLLIVALSEKKIRIEVGYGLEGQLTDKLSSDIIEYIIKPAFKQKKFSQGIYDATREIINILNNESTFKPTQSKKTSLPPFSFIFLIVVFIFHFISKIARSARHVTIFRLTTSVYVAALVGFALAYVGLGLLIMTGGAIAVFFLMFFVFLRTVTFRESASVSGGGFGGFGGSSSGGGFGGFSGGGGSFGGGGASGGW